MAKVEITDAAFRRLKGKGHTGMFSVIGESGALDRDTIERGEQRVFIVTEDELKDGQACLPIVLDVHIGGVRYVPEAKDTGLVEPLFEGKEA